VWVADKLAAYLTKYLVKTFEEVDEHHSKRYWHSSALRPPVVQKIWLGATSVLEAIEESHNIVFAETGQVDVMWLKEGWGSIFMTG
jgi:hypothetical protein